MRLSSWGQRGTRRPFALALIGGDILHGQVHTDLHRGHVTRTGTEILHPYA